MCAQRRRRMPSQKEPIGKTKSEILLFIANNQNCMLTDIRTFLRDNLNIRNQKGIRDHVSELLSEKLIQKVAQGKGMGDKYYIENTFSAFRNCFNYLHTNNFSDGFLETGFVKDALLSNDFFFFGLVNLIKELFYDMIFTFSNEQKFSEIVKEACKEGASKDQIDNMKKQVDKFKESNYEEFVLGIKNKTPEELIIFAQEMFQFPIKEILVSIVNEMFTQNQKEEIINILSTSPSAMDYFLNLRTENKLMFLTVILRFFIGIVFVDPSKVDIVNSFNNLEKESNHAQALSLMKEIVSTKNIVNNNPILTTLKAHFILDAVNGKTIKNEYSTKTLSKILIPEVKL